MKSLSYFFLIFVLFFFAACSDGIERIVPEADDHDTVDSGTDTGDTNHDTGDTADTDTGDTENPDTGDTENPDTGDTADTDTGDTDYPDTGDTADTDTGDTDTDSESDREKCNNVGGTWDSSAKKCYVTVTCDSKPDNSEWNGDSSYKIYYDLNTGNWEPVAYATEYGDGEQPCQYKCKAGCGYEDGECKPYCSAVFNGTSSKIEVTNNDLLNLGSGSWTIEAWIKQADEDLTSSYVPILRKGTSKEPSYVLTGYRKESRFKTTYTVTGSTTYSTTSTIGSSTDTDDLQVDVDVTQGHSEDWTHVALVHSKNATNASTKFTLTLYVNGTYKNSNSRTSIVSPLSSEDLLEVKEPLVIGANLYNLSKKYFKGKIDSIRISEGEKYKANFTPAKLSADGNDIIAFWDFSGNADESKNGLESKETGITYSTDCKQ